MADPLLTGADAEKAKLEAAAAGFVAKQKSWAQTNSVPLLIGFAAGSMLALLVHYVL